MPNFDSIDPSSPEVSAWIGRTHALLKKHDLMAAISFNTDSDFLHIPLTAKNNWSTMRTIINTAISTLELETPQEHQQVYGPGSSYDFYRDLKKIFCSAKNSLFLIDPYINEEVFDLYIDAVPGNVKIRLLTGQVSNALKTIIGKYKSKPGVQFKAKTSKKIHDRVVIIDLNECWVLGQSIKDAAKKKPTYIAPLPSDVVQQKVQHYEDIWNKSPAVSRGILKERSF